MTTSTTGTRIFGGVAIPEPGTLTLDPASTEIDREDFGITWNQALETGGVLVGSAHDLVELGRAGAVQLHRITSAVR